jgi:hypothetical protein
LLRLFKGYNRLPASIVYLADFCSSWAFCFKFLSEIEDTSPFVFLLAEYILGGGVSKNPVASTAGRLIAAGWLPRPIPPSGAASY